VRGTIIAKRKKKQESKKVFVGGKFGESNSSNKEEIACEQCIVQDRVRQRSLRDAMPSATFSRPS
jgi:hypothetical protein